MHHFKTSEDKWHILILISVLYRLELASWSNRNNARIEARDARNKSGSVGGV